MKLLQLPSGDFVNVDHIMSISPVRNDLRNDVVVKLHSCGGSTVDHVLSYPRDVDVKGVACEIATCLGLAERKQYV